MLELPGSSVIVVSDPHLFQKPKCRACTIRLRFAVFLLAQDAPADLRWLPTRDVLCKVVSEVGSDSSWPVGQTCTPDFFAFALDRIREAWKVSLMTEAELWAPKAMSYNSAAIPAGDPFVAHASSPDAFGFLVFKLAEVHAAVGPFVPGSSADISLSQSAGRLTLLPVSQRLDESNLPSAVLHLIRSIPKTEAFARNLLELAFQKVIGLLGVGDAASLVSLCDAMLPRKKRTRVPANFQQLLPYTADLAAPSSVNCPAERFSELLRSLEVLCCFADLRLFRHEAIRIKREWFLLAPKQKFRAEFSVTVDFGKAGRIEVSDSRFGLSWECPDPDEDGDHTKRVLSFWRREQTLLLSGKPTSLVKIKVFGSAKGFTTRRRWSSSSETHGPSATTSASRLTCPRTNRSMTS
jgi:hypothetical protein